MFQSCYCSCLAVVLGSFVAGKLLSERCLSEVGVVLAAQAFLILLWFCLRGSRLPVTLLYFLVCGALLTRETLLMTSGRVPCGLFTFGEHCIERGCVEYKDLYEGWWMFSKKTGTVCVREDCLKSERTELSRVFETAQPMTAQSWTALVCVWAAFLLSMQQLQKWQYFVTTTYRTRGHVNRQAMQHVAVILGVPITYGLCALNGFRSLSVNPEATWEAEGMMNAAELYSAISLFAFQRLLEVQVNALEPRTPAADGPSACLRCDQQATVVAQYYKLRRRFRQLVSWGVMQYTFLVSGYSALLMTAKSWDWLYPARCQATLAMVAKSWFPHHAISLTVNATVLQGSQHTRESTIACEDLWNTVSLLVCVANFFTCSIALLAVLQYEQSYSKTLESIRPFWKFWGVKGLLSVNFMQQTVLFFAAFTVSGRKRSKEFWLTLNFYLVCVESALLALLNVCAYRPWQAAMDEIELVPMKEDLEDNASWQADKLPGTLGRSYSD
eukprot:TRINITY_DN28545_c0_g2_i1.p1 TRINITY_DN28545_c0_g2~~TRINITY_DN28545_c0_g2_i1.p1  ORF type:complete len:498 (-),score=68.72 TRINITY_DN28545_c0_g2_i1:9-1502(-)